MNLGVFLSRILHIDGIVDSKCLGKEPSYNRVLELKNEREKSEFTWARPGAPQP